MSDFVLFVSNDRISHRLKRTTLYLNADFTAEKIIADKKSAVKIGDKIKIGDKKKQEIIEYLSLHGPSRTRDYLSVLLKDSIVKTEGNNKNRLYKC